MSTVPPRIAADLVIVITSIRNFLTKIDDDRFKVRLVNWVNSKGWEQKEAAKIRKDAMTQNHALLWGKVRTFFTNYSNAPDTLALATFRPTTLWTSIGGEISGSVLEQNIEQKISDDQAANNLTDAMINDVELYLYWADKLVNESGKILESLLKKLD